MTHSNISKIDFAMLSHQGIERENNDDKVFASAEMGLWILSDGVGGLAQGEQASQFVVDEVSKSIGKGLNLDTAVHSAHSVIKAYNRHETEDRGATVVTLLNKGLSYDIAWVGDSRAYLWNSQKQTLSQLTEDHTLVQKLVNAGLLSVEDAKTHPKRHVITQCLGIEDQHQLNIGLLQRKWKFGETILMVSDGLYDELSDAEIGACLASSSNNQSKAERLIEYACKKGGKDNLSLILINSPVKEPELKAGSEMANKFSDWLNIFRKR
ncbi:PP2C family serine/threonine-protein phosphatase [Kangiella sp. TOML190]|uniref:PP2C family protein-serine/threonine phosphatase n=1 Tax=Kangiella sp. TOML190 TaxID=2931351 RepID=UPI00203EA0BB|nr:protein phosphatase 2C domain-containing protein [Kangiella sp. TOML190]